MAADRVFHFSEYAPERRNLLWMIFTDQPTRMLFDPWEEQAHQLISHFRRDFVRATQAADISELIKDLENIDPDFKTWWHEQDIHGPYYEKRQLNVEGVGYVSFEHTMLTIDQDRHLRLVYYAAIEGSDTGLKFEKWVTSDPEKTVRN